MLLRDYWAVNDRPPSDLPLYAIHHTILVITISCEGRGVNSPPKHLDIFKGAPLTRISSVCVCARVFGLTATIGQ